MHSDGRIKILYKITHDLKSPLIGVKAALYNTAEIPEETVQILENVLSRLEKIDMEMEQLLTEFSDKNPH